MRARPTGHACLMRQQQFLQIVDRDEAERRWHAALGELRDLGSEALGLDTALGRVLAEDVVSELDVPGFDRANMDGWAVRAEDTYGATEPQPRRMRRAHEAIAIGALPSSALGPAEAMAIPTGGALPRGADAVLLVEGSELEGDEVVQLYLLPKAVDVPRHPVKALIDFARVRSLAPGATREVAFELQREGLLLATEAGDLACVPGEYELSVEDGAGERLTHKLTVTGQQAVVVPFPS